MGTIIGSFISDILSQASVPHLENIMSRLWWLLSTDSSSFFQLTHALSSWTFIHQFAVLFWEIRYHLHPFYSRKSWAHHLEPLDVFETDFMDMLGTSFVLNSLWAWMRIKPPNARRYLPTRFSMFLGFWSDLAWQRFLVSRYSWIIFCMNPLSHVREGNFKEIGWSMIFKSFHFSFFYFHPSLSSSFHVKYLSDWVLELLP